MIGQIGYEFQDPDTRTPVAEAIEKIQSDPESTQTVKTRFRHADGSWVWIESTLQNRIEDTDIGGILVNSRDISDRKRQERQYRNLAEEYRTLLESVEDAIFFITVESAESEYVFRFERLNQSYEDQTGITTEEVRNKTPTEVFGDELGTELQANYHRCVRARKPITY